MIKKISLPSSLRSGGKDSGKVVKYTPCSTSSRHLDDDLDEVAVISNAAPESIIYGSGQLSTANGPRVVPGIITSHLGGVNIQRDYRAMSTSSVSARPSISQIQIPLSVASTSIVSARPADGQKLKVKCASRQSLIDTVTGKFPPPSGGVSSLAGVGTYIGNGRGSDAKTKPRGSMAGLITRGHLSSDLEIPKKTRELRRKEIKKEFERWETSTSTSDKGGCNWSFVFDPSGRLCYYWSMVVSVAFLYNFWTIIYRCAFQEINEMTVTTWFILDYLSDFVYILDIAVHFRTGYLEEGVLQTDGIKLRQHYMNCTMFYIDCLCLLPLDFLYLSIGFKSMLRCFRLVKIYRFWAFLDRTERHTNYPNVFRTVSLVHYILVIFHWNACLCQIIHLNHGFGSQDWFIGTKNHNYCDGVQCDYLHAMYWSVLALTTIGDLPTPRTKSEYFFLVVEIVFGLFLFATVLGYVANIVTNVSAARKEFQAKLDAVKTYMRMRRVPDHIQTKVIRWFDYLWMTQKSSDEERSVGCLPDKLKAEIAIHVHLDTLKRVEIFQNTEAGFLCELVLRLRPVLFSPGDYICRKGEVGKEMYIVNRGRLQVVTDNGKTVLATLRAGSYFGEISILNMGTAGNRRTASVRSVGYSDLFCLNKQDMWDVLKDYPAARVRLEAIAVKRLEKYRKEPLKKIAMGRSRSTPGLVESKDDELERERREKEREGLENESIGSDCSNKLENTQSSQKANNNYNNNNNGTNISQSGSGIMGCSPLPGLIATTQSQLLYSPQILGPNLQLISYDRNSPQPQTALISGSIPFYPHSPVSSSMPPAYCGLSPAASSTHLAVPHAMSMHTPSPTLSSDSYHIQMSQPTCGDAPQEAMLLAEIKRLRERLMSLETENASMTIKLSQQQWEVENRLAEIELQICNATATGSTCGGAPGSLSSRSSSSGDENERNKESVI
ncbi:cyclic nucleotide-gated channel rod photoreceptor subunit alpha-like isoform X2 [Oppia nitens]|uniref:cyclic nucleotide-gated channel rod photoreceptor subunit alpha-like isoform X2 n=1 Tax=Oppia nitens TaxID=1686743 RepID=UPI0023DC36F1|nr:cyclic nucleotide-gated channel rod photoreceptor subunit alpha-like isoform X2 [Oppia nitens]